MKKTKADSIPIHCAHDKVVKLDRIKPNPRNPNKHPPGQIELLARIIKEQGWRAPIAISNRSGFIVRGHGRLMAAKLLGEKSVPVDYQDYDTDAEEWADLLADNRIAELAEIDIGMVQDILVEIDDSLDLDLTGFDTGTIEEMAKPSGTTSVDDFLGDNFELPNVDMKEKQAMDKVVIFIAADAKEVLFSALRELHGELGETRIRIVK